MIGPAQARVSSHEVKGLPPGPLQQSGIADQIGRAELRQTPLSHAEEFSRTPDPEILLRDDEAVGRLDQRLQPSPGGRGPLLVRRTRRLPRHQQQAGRSLWSPPYPATQLMQLRQSETIRVLDHHHGRVRHIHAHLDHRRRDEEMNLSRLKGSHGPLFIDRLHATVQHPNGEGRKLLSLQSLRALQGSLEVHLLRLLDQGINDIGLAPHGELIPDEGIDLPPLRLAEQQGADGEPPRRKAVDNRDVQIPIDRHGQRPWNRRRRQDQHIGSIAFLDQSLPLQDTEFLLLVDDRQPKPSEANPLLDKGVCANHDLGIAAFYFTNCRAPCLPIPTAFQQDRREAERGEEPAHRKVVLLRQDLGGNHQRSLVAGPTRDHHGLQGHHRLATPDIPLNQTIHGQTACHVSRDFRRHALLRLREAKRQGRLQARQERRADIKLYALDLFLDGALAQGQGDFQNKELLKGKTLVGPGDSTLQGLQGRVRGRKVDLPDRLTQDRQCLTR